MRRGRIFIYLALILIVGLAAVFFLYQQFLSKPVDGAANEPTKSEPMTRVAVITQFTPKGTVLDDSVVNLIPWQQDSVAIGMFSEERMVEVLGRQVKFDLQAGTPVMETMLLGAGEQLPMSGSSWAMNIPAGMIAVSIPIDRLSSVSYAPRPGDHVDVIASLLFMDLDTDFQTALPNYTGVVIGSGPPDPETKESVPLTAGVTSLLPQLPADPSSGKLENPNSQFPGIYGKVEVDPVLGQAVLMVPSEGQRPRLATHMLMQDAIVLQMGDFSLENEKIVEENQPVEGDQSQQDQPEAQVQKPVVATLIVRPQDAVTLNYLIYSGAQLTLALRGPNDTSRAAINPVTLQYLLDQYMIPVPLRLPYGMEPGVYELKPPESTLDPQPE
jgi:pilus assembly protein CpaB